MDNWESQIDSYYVRCVSGESKYEDIEFERDDNLEIVTDFTNDLVWQDGSSSTYTYSNAISLL